MGACGGAGSGRMNVGTNPAVFGAIEQDHDPMRSIVDFKGGGLDGHVEVDWRNMREVEPAQRKMQAAARIALMTAGTIGVGARFWSVSPEFVKAVRSLGLAEAQAKGLGGRHLYEITEIEDNPEVHVVCRFI